ncbi:MAG: GTP pyrophosphokinase family protein [Clostridia bacterium]
MKKTKNKEIGIVEMQNFLSYNEKIEEKTNTFEKIMAIYEMAINELETKINNLKKEYQVFYNYDLVDHVNTRIKTPKSIINKMNKKGYELTYKEMIENINDIAGVRIVCQLKDDIFKIRNLLEKIPGLIIEKEKDYVTYPKESGYSSYHLILKVPITLSNQIIYVKIEVQIRTLAMDFWATIEHKVKYKSEQEINKKVSKELVNYAKIVNKLDNKMMLMNN